MNNLPKHHGAGPPEARGPMQLHRLHRLKAGPGCVIMIYCLTTQVLFTRAFDSYRVVFQILFERFTKWFH